MPNPDNISSVIDGLKAEIAEIRGLMSEALHTGADAIEAAQKAHNELVDRVNSMDPRGCGEVTDSP